MNSRKMTYEELKIDHIAMSKENENLKITNELLIDNIKQLRLEKSYLQEELNQLKEQFSKAKEAQVERKKENLLNYDQNI
jgi:predicted nuclease with TOPRIM domain